MASPTTTIYFEVGGHRVGLPPGRSLSRAIGDSELELTAIVSTACRSGSRCFGTRIVNELGTKYFIAPYGSPGFSNSIFFAHLFYHKLFRTKHRVVDAFNSYNEHHTNPD